MMKKFLACIFFMTGFYCQIGYGQNENDVLNYIDKFKSFAIEEQLRTGVPAAITLAQGIHETAAGNSELATQANNHFGIKCKTNWTGETYLHDDDRKQECFRKYINAQQSYIDHSDFLKAGSRYQSLFELEITDYAGWASGLKKAGYATNPTYVKKLTDLVEKYNLQQYTYDALSAAGKKGMEIVPNNDAKNLDLVEDPNASYKGISGFWAKRGEMLQDKAAQAGIKYNKLLEINNLQDEPLPYDMFVFTARKKKTGTVEFHMVKEGENMHLISQKEAMNLDNLYAFNNLEKGDEPLPGEQLSLQYRSYGKPKLISKPSEVPVVQTVTEVAPVQTEPVTEKTTITATNTDIKDVAKAKKIEALLSGDNSGKSEINMTQDEVVKSVTPKEKATAKTQPVKTEPVKTEPVKTEPAKTEPVKEEVVVEAPAPKVEKKPVRVAPKRTYNEKGVDDSVKILKERFDNLVYRPFDRRVAPVQAKEPVKSEGSTEVKNTKTGITKETKKPVAVDTVKKVIKEEPKKAGIEQTKTGIVRDVKKIEEEKKKAKEALEAKKTPAKKTDPKAKQTPVAKKDNKEVLNKGTKKTPAKTPAKKDTKGDTKAKKPDPKKADPKKKDTKKK